jgi:ribosomal protein S18 acetylase RimI-like enzyme
MDTQEVARRVVRQRAGRFQDAGPALGRLGAARYRAEMGRLQVAYATLAPAAAPAAVDVIVRFARERRIQVQWTVVPTRSGEDELPAALRAAGFVVVEDLLLMARQGSTPAPEPRNPTIVVSHITSWQMLWQYEYGSRQSFYQEPEPAEALVTQRATERWREQEQGWCRYYAATSQGNVVGGCYVSLHEDVPTLMGVYTLPAARRRGVAQTLLAHVLRELAMMRRDVCCLFVEHGNPAELLYRALDFAPLFDMQTYTAL